MKITAKLRNSLYSATYQINIGDILTFRALAWAGNNIQEETIFKAILEALDNLFEDEFVKVTITLEPVKPTITKDGELEIK